MGNHHTKLYEYDQPIISKLENVFASGGDTKHLNLWDCNRLINVFNSQNDIKMRKSNHKKSIYCLNKYSEDFMLTGSFDNTIKVWDITTKNVVMTLEGHANFVWTIESSQKDNLVFSGGNDKTIRVFDIKSGKCIRVLKHHSKWVRSLKLDRKSDLLYSCSDDQKVIAYNVKKNSVSNTFSHTNRIYSLDFCENKDMLIASTQGDVLLFDSRNLQKPSLSLNLWRNKGMCVKYYESKYSIVVAAGDNVELFDLRRHEKPYKSFTVHPNRGTFNHSGLEVLPDGKIATAYFVPEIKLWNFKGEEVGSIKEGGNIYTLKYLGSPINNKFGSFGSNTGYYYSYKMVQEMKDDDVEKVDFLLDFVESHYDVEIILRNKTIKLFKFLLYDSKLKEIPNKININESLDVHEDILVKILLGISKGRNKNSKESDVLEKKLEGGIPKRCLFDYFILFKSLKMFKRCFLICIELLTIKNVQNLLFLFEKSRKKYEINNDALTKNDVDILSFHDDDEEEIQKNKNSTEVILNYNSITFNSVFSLATFNCLKKKEEMIVKNRHLMHMVGKLGLYLLLKEFKTKNIRNHIDLSLNLPSIPEGKIISHMDILINNFQQLYLNDDFSNLEIFTKDKKKFKVNREILLLRTNVFFRMIRFKGVEFGEMNESKAISIDFMNGEEFRYYLEYIYTGALKRLIGIDILIKLVNHAQMFQEHDLKFVIIDKIKEATSKVMSDKDRFVIFLQKYCNIIESQVVLGLLIKHWSCESVFREREIRKIINTSDEKKNLAEEVKHLKLQNKIMKIKVEELTKQVSNQRIIITNLEKYVKEKDVEIKILKKNNISV